MTISITPGGRSLFENLRDDVIHISYYWQIIRRLFMNPKTVDLLNQTAPNFFLSSLNAFKDTLLLSITRITDPAKSHGQNNLVITRLLDYVDRAKHQALYDELKNRIDDAIDRSKPFRPHRNKLLAHTDLDIRMKNLPLTIPKIPTEQIEQVVNSLQEVINTFGRYFMGSETVFIITENGGVKALTTYLRKGLDTFREEDEQRRGEILGELRLD